MHPISSPGSDTEARMKRIPTRMTMALILAACSAGTLAAPQSPTAAGDYVAMRLMSDRATPDDPQRAHADPRLVDPWGIAVAPRAYAWVANRGTSTARRYDGNGHAVSRVVTLPPGAAGDARPTGVVHDAAAQFHVVDGELSAACTFIVVGAAGTVTCWAPAANPLDAAVQAYDGVAFDTAYTGVAIARSSASSHLYAVDFRNGTIDVFDTSFARVAVPGGFVDPALPAGWAPFGIEEIGGLLAVAYVQREARGGGVRAAAGAGLVDVFDTDGHLVQRLVAPGGPLNAPWGMAQAPRDFGPYGGALLVANGGDGTIDAFDAMTGAFLGALAQPGGERLVIEGLRGIAFGRGLADEAADPPSLYYTAASSDGHGTYGRIDAR
jgi:uncharacterized protein (TIGR03118 family)